MGLPHRLSQASLTRQNRDGKLQDGPPPGRDGCLQGYESLTVHAVCKRTHSAAFAFGYSIIAITLAKLAHAVHDLRFECKLNQSQAHTHLLLFFMYIWTLSL